MRHTAQISIAMFNAWIGYRFYLFYSYYRGQGGAFVPRPPSVEAYLPISALLALKAWLLTGVYDAIHPAGLTILVAILLTTIIFRRGFCSWICPVGTLSEGLWRLGAKLIGRSFSIPAWLDIPLRALKYLLLSFFLYITAVMTPAAISMFLDSPFNRVADIQMLRFFMYIGPVGLGILGGLVIGSLLTKNFWCRYLCPYGALLGLISLASPIAIERDANTCRQCHTCDNICPARIRVSSKTRVNSPECSACLECVENCPEKSTLSVRVSGLGSRVVPAAYGVLLVGLFFGVLLVGQHSGRWQTNITPAEYAARVPRIESAVYEHP